MIASYGLLRFKKKNLKLVNPFFKQIQLKKDKNKDKDKNN